MFRFGRITCALCRAPARSTDVLRGRAVKGVTVCKECYEEWEAMGRRCVGCDKRVFPGQEVGIFMERHGFGHAECGAVWLAVP